MNVLDGVRHLNQSIMEDVSRQFGADGVEIDAHMLCAEDHLPYQGGQYTNEEFEEIQDSLPRPFGEWNCRHSWHGIILGVSPPTYTPEQLEEMQRYSTEELTIDGRTKTRYQWTQEMRRCESAIRRQKDTATLARMTGDQPLQRRCQGQIGALNDHYRQLAGKVGVAPEFNRTYVAGFRDAKNIPVRDTGDVGVPNGQIIDWASANSFAGGDTRLTNMLRSGDAQQTASAVNEILNGESYGFRESKWSGHVNVGNNETMERALGRKEWSCDISIREDNVGNIKTYIHEDLHSRSASHFSPDTYARHKASEEAAVEYMAQQICERAKIPYNPSYTERVNALKDIRSILEPKTSEYDFAKAVFDMDENLRYTYIANRVNDYKINTRKMRDEVRDRLNEDLRILAGIRKGGRSYDGR